MDYTLYERKVVERMESTFAEQIGAKIKLHRESRKWTQERLAEAIGSTASYIGQLERGEKNVKIHTIEKVANAFGISISQMFENEQESFLYSNKWIWNSLTILLRQNEFNQRKAYRILSELFAEDESSKKEL
ncbi:helix-turn-helix domain-containing protein [Paenibacillus chitinolyticus]|uniref:helix-turn-helix domain-containing protein n=1 Tax=Paenibacillus chitinolyticus TaxID=79263 RepID=UPI00295E272B|nr:helix-turn-helix domain-containing protein [Paenibacillus chitinolyticus]